MKLRKAKRSRLLGHRILECCAMGLIGDGALAVIEPRRHIELWFTGPKLWRKMMLPFMRSPTLTRWFGAAEVAAGFWLASKQ
jgi:hypothetical protein